ncbi:MAG: hypothetical protein J07HN6_02738 [Halonotius sp. J07HN6]|nr:MAG: hypothetical protein J07HN6_02738 [Halonotius sp. J07HN6]
MDTDSFRREVVVASAAAGATVALSLVFEFVLAVTPSFYLQVAPLSVYFLYLFGHGRLPDRVDQPPTWVGVAVAVAVVSLAVGVL